MTEARIEPSPEGVPGAVIDPIGLRGEDLKYPGYAGDPVNAFLARPEGKGPLSGMVVVHEAGGLGAHIRDVVARVAQLGYVTIGVDLYSREGGPPEPGNMQALFERIFSIPDERVLEDLTGAIDVLRGRSDARGPVGIIGFCMGGRYTLLAACSLDGVDAAVDCWGGFIDRSTPDEVTTPERPRPPLDLIAGLSCPLMAAIGAEDQNPSPPSASCSPSVRSRRARTSRSTSTRAPATRSSRTTGRAIAPARRSSCGSGSCRSCTATFRTRSPEGCLAASYSSQGN